MSVRSESVPARRPSSRPAAALATAVLVATALTAAPCAADGILAESLLPRTGVGAQFGWAGGENDANAYELILRGGWSGGLAGTELLIPLGWYAPGDGETEFGVGNIGLQGRAGTGINLGLVQLDLAGALTAYLPTATKPLNRTLTPFQLLRPGLRATDAVPIELAASATLAVMLFELTGTFGTTIIFPTDGSRTHTWVHGGIAAGVYIVPMLQLVGEYALAARTGELSEDLHQVGIGIKATIPLVTLGVNVRIPIGGRQLDDAPVVLGLDARVGF